MFWSLCELSGIIHFPTEIGTASLPCLESELVGNLGEPRNQGFCNCDQENLLTWTLLCHMLKFTNISAGPIYTCPLNHTDFQATSHAKFILRDQSGSGFCRFLLG